MAKKRRKQTKRALRKRHLVANSEDFENRKDLGGRPRAFKTPEELQVLIDEYFEYCNENKIHYGVVGMCVYLNIVRNTLCEYEKIPEFKDTIKLAKQRIESYSEQMMYDKTKTTGAIFNLKANFGWSEKQEITQNITADIKQDVTVRTVEDLLNDSTIEL